MARRILAWLLLTGFVALIINLIFIRYEWQLFLWIYLVIAIIYILFFNRKDKKDG